jgi:hypothetical protein
MSLLELCTALCMIGLPFVLFPLLLTFRWCRDRWQAYRASRRPTMAQMMQAVGHGLADEYGERDGQQYQPVWLHDSTPTHLHDSYYHKYQTHLAEYYGEQEDEQQYQPVWF